MAGAHGNEPGRDPGQAAVGTVEDTSQPMARAPRDLGENAGALDNGAHRDRAAGEGHAELTKDDAEDLSRLWAGVAELRMEVMP